MCSIISVVLSAVSKLHSGRNARRASSKIRGMSHGHPFTLPDRVKKANLL